MREIKFRAWGRVKKPKNNGDVGEWKMFELSGWKYNDIDLEGKSRKTLATIYPERGLNVLWTRPDGYQVELGIDCHLMQYTGVKDKNGKEIYEKDILQSLQVGYEGDYKDGMLVVDDILKNGSNSLAIEVAEYDLVVIGNIYENPELLK